MKMVDDMSVGKKQFIDQIPSGYSRFYDLTMPIQPEMPLWPGDGNKVEHWFTKLLSKGDSENVSRIAMSVHTGTHVDAPYHHLTDGKKIENWLLDRFVGPAVVHDLTHVENAIKRHDLECLNLQQAPICLFKTRNSQFLKSSKFNPDYVHITPEAASYLISQNVSVVGIDYLSVESFHVKQPETHRILLGADIVIIENLNFHDVPVGSCYFICLPLKIIGAEAAPARAFLLRNKTSNS